MYSDGMFAEASQKTKCACAQFFFVCFFQATVADTLSRKKIVQLTPHSVATKEVRNY